MEKDKINSNISAEIDSAVLDSTGFLSLNDDLKSQIISNMYPKVEKRGGLIGKLLGNNPENVALNIGFLICAALLLLVLCNLKATSLNFDLLDKVFPIITLTLGYIFGKNSGK